MYSEAFTGVLKGVNVMVKCTDPNRPTCGNAFLPDGSFKLVTTYDLSDVVYHRTALEAFKATLK